MPTLDWIGKRAVLNHHRDVPFHLLKVDEGLSAGDRNAGNLLVQGDNLFALKALLPHYAGRVKCIYIDPPYNTGAESWVYDDAVRSPEMREWLGTVVGPETEDLSRHDKWLCMMYPRLALLREFLRPDGVVFVSIDDNEHASLRLVMEEIFGPRNFIGTLVWKRRSSSAMRGTPLSIDHEYVVAFGKDSSLTSLYGLAKSIEDYPFEDGVRRFASTDLTVGMGRDERPGQFYPIKNPRTGVEYPPNPDRVWRFFPDTMKGVIEADLIIWPDESPGQMERPRYKTYFDPETQKPRPVSTWVERDSANDRKLAEDEVEFDVTILRSGMTQEGGKLLQQILASRAFPYPKPLSLVRSLVRAATRSDDVVLDSFAGSGTTGHAVLDLNVEDGGQRRFVLVERDQEIARSIAHVRLSRVVSGYSYTTSKGRRVDVPALQGGYAYCRLGDPLLDQSGSLNADVGEDELAALVFFVATGMPLPRDRTYKLPLVGVHSGTAVYLLFNGVLGDVKPKGGNILTGEGLAALAPHDGPRVVFAEGCRLGEERLAKERITFRQIPYQIQGV